MPWITPFALWTFLLSLLKTGYSNYSVDQCNWKGSGLSQEPGSVEQIFLHCAEGEVEWLYPVGALRLSLSPRLPRRPVGPASPGGSGRITVCIKPAESFRGAQVYLEQGTELQLVLRDEQGEGAGLEEETGREPKVHCFSRLPGERVALFIQSTLHRDISRRIAAFKYDLRGDWGTGALLPQQMERACRPCNDTEVLMAVCTSDFAALRRQRDPALGHHQENTEGPGMRRGGGGTLKDHRGTIEHFVSMLAPFTWRLFAYLVHGV
ncbi:meteorin isoform X3 [Leucoraja erinacea]|uniref:meteorin isoform X3 n=1 Tax=Leucoraja erinaceus TaxID=7782 RepID=UPI00245494E4|nr:meteorin isoform X3 [Leucoraja erinacea]